MANWRRNSNIYENDSKIVELKKRADYFSWQENVALGWSKHHKVHISPSSTTTAAWYEDEQHTDRLRRQPSRPVVLMHRLQPQLCHFTSKRRRQTDPGSVLKDNFIHADEKTESPNIHTEDSVEQRRTSLFTTGWHCRTGRLGALLHTRFFQNQSCTSFGRLEVNADTCWEGFFCGYVDAYTHTFNVILKRWQGLFFIRREAPQRSLVLKFIFLTKWILTETMWNAFYFPSYQQSPDVLSASGIKLSTLCWLALLWQYSQKMYCQVQQWVCPELTCPDSYKLLPLKLLTKISQLWF